MQDRINEIKTLLKTDIRTAEEKTVALLKDAEVNGGLVGRADAYHLMGLVAYYDNRSKDATSWYGKELKLREKLKDIKGASDILNNLGAIYYQQGKMDKAKGYYEKALSYREKVNDKRGIAAVYNNLAELLLKSGQAAEAFVMHSRALDINRELGDTERIAASLHNIGLTYFSQGDNKPAISHFQEALDIYKEIPNRTSAISVMINIGATLFRQNKIGEAKKYYLQCYDESVAINYHHGLILSLQSLAHLESQQGHYREAIRYDEDCISIAQTTEHVAEITTSLSNMGRSYAHLKDYTQALQYHHDALIMARKTGIKGSLSDIYRDISEVYEKLADYRKSLEYYRKYIGVRDELVNTETTKTISEIKTRYEVEKKEKEAQLLKEKNEAINMYARKLELSNNSLKQFAHVASHDLREPLRMVSSYMDLLRRSMGDALTADQRQFVDFAVDGARRMDTLIHDLLRLAKVDADPRITQVPLTDIVSEVSSNLEVLQREKNARILSDPLPTIMADRTQIMQLLQNIIGNGIKYNESAEPTITIGYEVQGTSAILSIADNGIGIPEEYREKAFQIFQRVPTARQYQGSGIGLAICRKIVDSLDGSIAITDRAGGGTVFVITIPASLVVG